MSCNGCRVLRKGCSESCILRPCLQWIGTPEAQGHATVFVAKFFGRAGLMSFISGVAEDERPALFQSLLFEACGRTVNPVNGAVGLLGSGNWSVCQSAVETVLRGGVLSPQAIDASQVLLLSQKTQMKRRRADTQIETSDLDLSLSSGSGCLRSPMKRTSHPVAVALYSEEESSMTSMESGCGGYSVTGGGGPEKRILNLFV